MALDLRLTADKKTAARGRIAQRFADRSALRMGSRRVTARERDSFTEQLALLLETGTALHGALSILQHQVDNPTWRTVLGQVQEDIVAGQSFSQALTQHPNVFSVTYVKLVAASEGGGFLPEVLNELVAMGEKRDELQRKVVSAFSYPAFLAVFSLTVVVFVLAVVFPKFAEMFGAIRSELPATTVALMAASDVVRHHWILLLVLCAGICGGLGYWWGTAVGRITMDRLKLAAPWVGAIFVRLYLSQSLRVLSLSLSHGVPMVDALIACRDVVRNTVFQRFLQEVERGVREGRGLSVGFQEAGFIPSLARQMVSTGEETGNLPKIMERVAAYYESELKRRLETFARLAEPAMLLVMGVVVGVVVSSLILPILKLSRAVS
jgi:type II secretory pathway component PulF